MQPMGRGCLKMNAVYRALLRIFIGESMHMLRLLQDESHLSDRRNLGYIFDVVRRCTPSQILSIFTVKVCTCLVHLINSICHTLYVKMCKTVTYTLSLCDNQCPLSNPKVTNFAMRDCITCTLHQSQTDSCRHTINNLRV
jgi:hypothetical protein